MPEQEFLPKEKLDLPKPHEELAARNPSRDPQETQHVSRDQSFQEKTNDFLGMKSPSAPPQDYKTLISWHAPGRPFRVRSRAYYVNVILIMLLVEIVLFLFGQYALMAVVIALVFMTFALAAVPPVDFRYVITTEGVTIEDRFFLWQELYDFYFRDDDHTEILIIRTHSYFPGELYLTLGQMHRDHLRQVIMPYLPYREFITPTFMDKAGNWLKRNIPLEHSPTRV